jgi:hypothetical protein
LSVLETWTQNTEANLREGMNKEWFKAPMKKGVKILGMCQDLIETTNNACRHAESLGESSDAIEARKIIAEPETQLQNAFMEKDS